MGVNKELEGDLESKATEPEETYSFTEDKIPIVNPLHSLTLLSFTNFSL